MMFRWLTTLFLFAVTASGASAWPAHGKYVNNGQFVLNLGINGQGGNEFLNLFKNCISLQASASGGFAYPSILSADGYPTAAPTNQIFCVMQNLAMPDNPTMVVEFTGTGGITITGAFTVTSDPGSCVQGSTAFSLTLQCTNGRVEFHFTTSFPTSANVQFNTTATISGLSNAVLVRKDQEANLAAGAIFNPDFVNLVKGANTRVVRFLDWAQLSPNQNLSQYRYRTRTTAFTYGSVEWPSGTWAGTVSGTDTYAVGNAPDSNPAAYVDGEMITTFVTNANTITTPTLNRNGLGAVTIKNLGTGAISAGTIGANSLQTFVYDAALNIFMQKTGGIRSQVPIEVQIAFCNAVMKDCWIQVPSLFDQASSDFYVAYARDNLNGALNLYYEYSNEMWAFGNSQTGWGESRGEALGWTGSPIPVLSFYAMKVCTYMASALTTWTATGRSSSQLHRVMTTQTSTNPTNAEKYLFEGFNINPSNFPSVPVSCHTAPNRPVDNVEIISMAPYLNGAQMVGAQNTYANTITDAVTAADNYASGTAPNIASALAFMDNDVRAGTRNGVAGTATLLWFNGTIFPLWQTFGALYGKEVTQYEGGYAVIAPTAATLTNLGLTSSSLCGTAACLATEFENLLEAYKNSPLFQQMLTDQFNNFKSYGNSGFNAWYFLLRQETPPSQWGIYSGNLNSMPFKSLNALQQFNFLLKRDVDPAANDNSPMWLERAA